MITSMAADGGVMRSASLRIRSRPARRAQWLLLSPLGVLAMVVGCACIGEASASVRVTRDDRWTASMQIAFSPVEVQAVGGPERVDQNVQQALGQALQHARAAGAQI